MEKATCENNNKVMSVTAPSNAGKDAKLLESSPFIKQPNEKRAKIEFSPNKPIEDEELLEYQANKLKVGLNDC